LLSLTSAAAIRASLAIDSFERLFQRDGLCALIPQGARLIGVYDSQVAFGQSRVLLVWTRLIMPNGRSIVLERQQGADAGGYSGLEDEVDNHWTELVKAAMLSAIQQSTARKGLDLGLRNYTRADLEAARQAGEMLHINVLGLASIEQDVTADLARATIASVSVLGALHATPAVKAALADRTR
jgi:type IV secretory pathway VirB10-like protein